MAPSWPNILVHATCLFLLLLAGSIGVLAESFDRLDENDGGDAPPTNAQPLLPTSSGPTESTESSSVQLGFVHGFVASFSVILVSEIGDKTFFIACIMAMRHSRLVVFCGAIFALFVMTVLSVVFGWLVTWVPRTFTYYVSTGLFALAGLKMLRDGLKMRPNEGQEEFEEVSTELRKKDEALEIDLEAGREKHFWTGSRVFLQAFTMTFLAEWGDRSQLATVVLAAREDFTGVTLGAVIGHSICTGMAVLGGRFIAQKISVRTVTIIGGCVFLVFAFSALFFDPNA